MLNHHFEPSNIRSSHQRCSMKKGVLRNFTKFTGKHQTTKNESLKALYNFFKCIILGVLTTSFLKKHITLDCNFWRKSTNYIF